MKSIYIFLAAFSFGSFAFASGGVGPAGCGLGNMMFGKDSQVLAATTNGSSASQLFGITSGTSNCVDTKGVAKLESYVEANQVALASDIARGNGETISGLTHLLNCENSDLAKTSLKQNYEMIFNQQNSSALEVSNGIRQVLRHENTGCLI